MAKSFRPPAFAAITQKRLAVGAVPSSDDEWNWLLQQGLRVYVAHGKNPQNMEASSSISPVESVPIERCWIAFLRCGRDEEPDELSSRDIGEFIAPYFGYQVPVYICSSLGVEVASGIARTFLAKSDLHIANYLRKRADDLGYGDSWDWERGHEAFHGNTIYAAISLLIAALSNTDPETRTAAAGALLNLMEHVIHGCFPEAAVKMLIAVRSEVEVVLLAVRPDREADYQAIFKRLEKYSTSPTPWYW